MDPRDRQQTTCSCKTALRTIVHRVVKMLNPNKHRRISPKLKPTANFKYCSCTYHYAQLSFCVTNLVNKVRKVDSTALNRLTWLQRWTIGSIGQLNQFQGLLSHLLVCQFVSRSVQWANCGKSDDWIRMPFGAVSEVSQGMGALNRGGYSRRGRGSFEGECGASHCNQLGFCRIVVWNPAWINWDVVCGGEWGQPRDGLSDEGQHSPRRSAQCDRHSRQNGA